MVGPRIRLVLLVAGLAALFATFTLSGAISEREVRDVVEPLGPAGPPAYVLVAAVLGCLLVPGPLLAAASGVLFGTVLGVVVTLSASILGALLGRWLGERLGREGAEQVGGVPVQRAGAWVERHGLLAVVVQRLLPGVPDGPVNYAFGALRVLPRHLALGTAIGSAPRAFAYTALGDSLDDLTSPLALVAVGVILLAGLVGLLAARRTMFRGS